MAQYRTDTKKLDAALQTRFETFVLSDRFTASGNATDAFGVLESLILSPSSIRLIVMRKMQSGFLKQTVLEPIQIIK